jgi:hypothetical protein
MQLVAVEQADGWAYDLWVPGYAWAETVGLWRPPGLLPAGSSNEYRLDHAPLTRAFASLAAAEAKAGPAAGHWALAHTLSPFSQVEGRSFPVIGAFVHEGRPTPSRLDPLHVAEVLGAAWD